MLRSEAARWLRLRGIQAYHGIQHVCDFAECYADATKVVGKAQQDTMCSPTWWLRGATFFVSDK